MPSIGKQLTIWVPSQLGRNWLPFIEYLLYFKHCTRHLTKEGCLSMSPWIWMVWVLGIRERGINLFPGFTLRINYTMQVSPSVEVCGGTYYGQDTNLPECSYFCHSPFFCFLSFSPFNHPIKLQLLSHSIYSSLPVSPSLPLLSSHLFKDFATCIIRIFNT